MNANANTPTKNISHNEREAFYEALSLYYTQGPPITRAFDQVEAGLIDRYYRRKKSFPDEIRRIDREARRMATEEIAGDQQAAAARAMRHSHEIQRRAREMLIKALPHIASIALGEVQVYETGEVDKDGKPKVKRMVPYPRDILAAIKVVQDLARYGVLPKGYSPPSLEAEMEEEKPKGPMIPFLGIGSDFRKVTATMPDGTEVSAEVKPGDFIDAEAEEL
jgi:hypothetical protein